MAVGSAAIWGISVGRALVTLFSAIRIVGFSSVVTALASPSRWESRKNPGKEGIITDSTTVVEDSNCSSLSSGCVVKIQLNFEVGIFSLNGVLTGRVKLDSVQSPAGTPPVEGIGGIHWHGDVVPLSDKIDADRSEVQLKSGRGSAGLGKSWNVNGGLLEASRTSGVGTAQRTPVLVGSLIKEPSSGVGVSNRAIHERFLGW